MRDVYVMGNILRDEFVMNHHEFVTRPSLVCDNVQRYIYVREHLFEQRLFEAK